MIVHLLLDSSLDKIVLSFTSADNHGHSVERVLYTKLTSATNHASYQLLVSIEVIHYPLSTTFTDTLVISTYHCINSKSYIEPCGHIMCEWYIHQRYSVLAFPFDITILPYKCFQANRSTTKILPSKCIFKLHPPKINPTKILHSAVTRIPYK